MNELAPPLQQLDRTFVIHRGQRLSYFGGCDYFRLASHPAVLQALQDGVGKYGLNVAASRLTTGNHPLYEQLEQRLAAFFGAETALLVSNGYVTNLVVAQALAGRISHVLIDERAYAALADAAPLFGCPVLRFKHRDADNVADTVQRLGKAARPILLTDGLFSHNGQVAPLKGYLAALPGDARLLVDDAHGAGTIGPKGRGTAEHLGVCDRRLIQTITLSKAFGVYGGAILGPAALRKRIIAASRMFGGNTPLPLPLANAALAAVNLLRADKAPRRRLVVNTTYVKTAVREAGLPVPETPGPIVSLVPRRARDGEAVCKQLLARKIFPSFIRYPGGPKAGYFRFAIASEHASEQLDALISVLRDSVGQLRPLPEC